MNFYLKALRHTHRGLLSLVFMSSVSCSVWSLDYGIYDTRSLAMGGAGVATATGQHAQFSNPALLAMYDGAEEDTRNGRVYLPVMVVQLSESVNDTVDVVDEELDTQLSSAINTFNADRNLVNAQSVADTSRDLLDGINQVGNRDLDGEVFIGFSVSEPSDRAGGSFYFGARAIGGGTSEVRSEDTQLLNRYIEMADFIASGGTAGALHLDLVDADNNLIDPSDQITSSANIASLIIAEWGVAVARELQIWGQNISLGATPKLTRVDVFVEEFSYGDTELNYQEEKRSYLGANLDVGLVWRLGDSFRVALASKDLIPQSYGSGSGAEVELSARSRLGLAYVNQYVSFGIDMDLQSNEAIGSLRPGQELAAGLEINPFRWMNLRFGYRQDMEGFRDDVLSAGLGFHVGGFVADLAYANSEDIQGAGLQLGWTF